MKSPCFKMENHTEAFISINVLFPKQNSGFTGVYYTSPYTLCISEIYPNFWGSKWEICRMWNSLEGETTGKGVWMDIGVNMYSCVLEPRNLISIPFLFILMAVFLVQIFIFSVASCLFFLIRVLFPRIHFCSSAHISPLSVKLERYFIAYIN